MKCIHWVRLCITSESHRHSRWGCLSLYHLYSPWKPHCHHQEWWCDSTVMHILTGNEHPQQEWECASRELGCGSPEFIQGNYCKCEGSRGNQLQRGIDTDIEMTNAKQKNLGLFLLSFWEKCKVTWLLTYKSLWHTLLLLANRITTLYNRVKDISRSCNNVCRFSTMAICWIIYSSI